jgi:aspartyl-tRNA(Asn)/glutamyl-tRNA(Gln) amidotransferase subunit A
MYLEDVFTLPANLAGVPGLSFPVGFDKEKPAIGMQLMAAHFREDHPFTGSHLFQQHTEWHKAKPPL